MPEQTRAVGVLIQILLLAALIIILAAIAAVLVPW